jgi:hypothetical protein
MNRKIGLLLLTILIGFTAVAQQQLEVLQKQPNFLKARLKHNDPLFIEDVELLKQFIDFDSVDVELLKPQLLYTIVSETKPDTVITYQKLIAAINSFKQGIGYVEFRKGIVLYREMAGLKVNPKNWEKDQLLFRKLGFTEADLEDFLLFISKPENASLNYKQAYLAYMKEIDSL